MFASLRGSLSGSKPTADGAKDGTSLTSILSAPAERIEFVLLIILCANKMRDDLSATFDVSQVSSPEQGHPLSASASSAPMLAPTVTGDLIDMGIGHNPPSYAAATQGRGRYDYDRREEQLAEPAVQKLRQAALAHLKTWRVGILRRIGEVLGVRSDEVLREKKKRDAENASPSSSSPSTGSRSAQARTSMSRDRPGSGYCKPISTRLLQLDEPKRILLVNSLLLLLLSLEQYPAQSRVLLLRVASSLYVSESVVVEQENKVAQALLASAAAVAAETITPGDDIPQQMSAERETQRRANQGSAERAWKVGLATVGGAVLLGVTGGLAAPLLAAGVGSVLGGIGLGSTAVAGLLGALAGNAVLVGGLFGAYGGRMTGQIAEQYAREVRDFAFIPLRGPVEQDQHRLRVAIAASGWLTDEEDVTRPWRVLSDTGSSGSGSGSGSSEAFALRWEVEALLRLGTGLTAVLRSYAWDSAVSVAVRHTALATLMAGLWPLGLIRLARVAENPFIVARARADRAGAVLADALINRAQGERPVTLVGYSLGARTIYACLQALADRRAFGLVETVVLLGAPVPSDAPDWRRMRAVVAGRLVNVHSGNDFILGLLYRSSSVQLGVAGLEEVRDVVGVESFDASGLVSGHARYPLVVGAILKEIGFADLDLDAVAREERDLREMDEKERRLAREKEEQKRRGRGRGGNNKPESREQQENLIDLDEEQLHDAKELGTRDIQREVGHLLLDQQQPHDPRERAEQLRLSRPENDHGTEEEGDQEGGPAIAMIDEEEAEAEAQRLERQVEARLEEKGLKPELPPRPAGGTDSPPPLPSRSSAATATAGLGSSLSTPEGAKGAASREDYGKTKATDAHENENRAHLAEQEEEDEEDDVEHSEEEGEMLQLAPEPEMDQ